MYVLKHCLKRLKDELGVATWGDLEACLSCGPLKLPEGMTLAHIEALPEAAGKYVLKDAEGQEVFRGRSANIRKRVRALFKASNRTEKAARFRELVRSIEAVVA